MARRTWWIPLSGIAEPVFYLLSIGIGIGKLVGGIPGPDGTTIPYAAYVAPGLLAASAMNGAVYESTFNVYFKLKYAKIFDAVLATPVEATEVARGEITYALIRGTVYAAVFVVMMAALGDIDSPWAVLALPAAVLIGFAFAAVGMAPPPTCGAGPTSTWCSWCCCPLFLFSTTFYPLSIYPRWLQLVVECTPLYQGVSLIRALTLGHGRAWPRSATSPTWRSWRPSAWPSSGRRIRVLLLR